MDPYQQRDASNTFIKHTTHYGEHTARATLTTCKCRSTNAAAKPMVGNLDLHLRLKKIIL